jgi:hypothetical protein
LGVAQTTRQTFKGYAETCSTTGKWLLSKLETLTTFNCGDTIGEGIGK